MKVLRITQYPPEGPITSGVVTAADLNVPVEEFGRPDTPGIFYAEEIFDMEGEPTIEEATRAAMARVDHATEANMAVYYYWTANGFLIVRKGGVVANPDPCPFTSAQLAVCMRQLADHPDYNEHRVVTMANDGVGLVLANGHVTTEARP